MNFQPLQDMMDKLTSGRYPGNAAVVYAGGKRVFAYASGFADVETREPMTTEHDINLYSCSKVATVTAALQLWEKGAFGLDDPLYAYIPEFRCMTVKTAKGLEKATGPITLRHLFTMTAGLNYDTGAPAFDRARSVTEGRMDTLEVLRCLAAEPLEFEPGTHWRYSLCHDVLAGVVEVVSGKKFRDYVKENIFSPLGMDSCCYHNEAVQPKMAALYRYVTGDITDPVVLQSGLCPQGEGYWKEIKDKTSHYVFGPEYDSGGAGITGTTEDYAKLCAALAASGMGLTGERILKPETVALLRQNVLDETLLADFNWPQLKGFGYGLGVRTVLPGAATGEFGWGGAAGSSVFVDSDAQACLFYAAHMLNPMEEYYQPRIRSAFYESLKA